MKRFLSICAVVLATVGCANFEEGASLSPTSGAHHTISAVTDLTPLSRVGFERVEGDLDGDSTVERGEWD